MPTINDNRTPAQRDTHRHLIIMSDRCLSGWGGAAGGASYAAWACETHSDARKVRAWVSKRSDASRVREVYDAPAAPYRPGRGCAHLTIYVVGEGHPSLSA